MRSVLLIFLLLVLPLQVAFSETLTLAHRYPPENTIAEIMETFAQDVAEQGSITIKVIGNSAFGRSREYPDLLRFGKLDLAVVSQNDLERIPVLRVFELPFLIRDRAMFMKVLDGPARKLLDEAFATEGLQLLAVLDGSFRLIGLTNRSFDTLFDLKGIKMRTIDHSSRALFEGVGVSSVTLPFGELPIALDRGMIDAYETTFEGVNQGKLGAISRQILLTKHLYEPQFLVASEARLRQLGSHNVEVLRAIANKIERLSFEQGEKDEQRFLAEVREMGVEVRETQAIENDMQWLIESSRHIYDEYATEVKDGAELVKYFLNQ